MKATRFFFFSCCAVFAIFFCFQPSLGQTGAQAPPAFTLHSLDVTARGSLARLHAFLSVRNAWAMENGLTQGAILEWKITASLLARRSLMPDRVLSSTERSYQIRFDTLTREYVMQRPGHPVLRQKRLAPLLEAVLSDLRLDFPLAENLVQGGKYRVALTLSIRQADVPAFIEKTLFFWSWEVISPATFTYDFVYERSAKR